MPGPVLERVISDKGINEAPLVQQPPPIGHSIRVNAGPARQANPPPVYAREGPVINSPTLILAPGQERIVYPAPNVANEGRFRMPMPAIPEHPTQSNPPSVTSSIKMERQPSVPTPILQLQSRAPSNRAQETTVTHFQPQQIITNPPQIVESVDYSRSGQRTTTSKILENLQGNAVV